MDFLSSTTVHRIKKNIISNQIFSLGCIYKVLKLQDTYIETYVFAVVKDVIIIRLQCVLLEFVNKW